MKNNPKNSCKALSLMVGFALLAGMLPASGSALGQDDIPGQPTAQPGEDVPGINPSAITVPTPLQPSGTIYVQKPTYQWSAVSGATKYQYQVYKGTTKLIDKTVTTTSHTPNVTLVYAAHQWRVRAYKSGAWRAWSAYRTFTVVNPVPTLQSPDGTVYTQKPTYEWSAVSGATNYHFEVYQGATKVIDGYDTSTSVTPNVALNYADHQWRVQAYAGGAWKAWSAYKDFTVIDPVPTLQSPDGSIYYIRKPTYRWDAVSGATNYHYEVYEGETEVIDGYDSGTSVTPDIVLNYGMHQWRVQAYAGGEWQAFSGGKVFTVEHTITMGISVGGNGQSYYPAIAEDADIVSFTSIASNLVDGDTNNFYDIFVYDIASETITRVSVDSSGNQANSSSNKSNLSADGRYVVFDSSANNLIGDGADNNCCDDVFLHDRQTGSTTLISLNSSGGQGNFKSKAPSISSNGRYVAFQSLANNLVDGDTNSQEDIFVHDRQTNTNTIVSVDSSGGQSNYPSLDPAISADGRYVAFTSWASNLVEGDYNGTSDIFVHDRQTSTTTCASVNSSGVVGVHSSHYPAISADGRYIAFMSYATNLVDGDTNNSRDIFVHDLITGVTTRVSVDSNGTQGNTHSNTVDISADGRYVFFSSSASNLVNGDTNGKEDIFVHDRLEGTTIRVSLDSDCSEANGNSIRPVVAEDLWVTFESYATNLVSGDSNEVRDIFLSMR